MLPQAGHGMQPLSLPKGWEVQLRGAIRFVTRRTRAPYGGVGSLLETDIVPARGTLWDWAKKLPTASI